MKKYWLVIIAVFILAVAGLFITAKNKQTPSTTNVQMKSFHVQQFIQPDAKQEIQYQEETVQTGKTALDHLKATHTVETQGEGKNAFITSIDNRKADTAKREFWAFYVNGKQAELGAGSYQLKSSDKLLWKIETY